VGMLARPTHVHSVLPGVRGKGLGLPLEWGKGPPPSPLKRGGMVQDRHTAGQANNRCCSRIASLALRGLHFDLVTEACLSVLVNCTSLCMQGCLCLMLSNLTSQIKT
jgi:hypothetical protein